MVHIFALSRDSSTPSTSAPSTPAPRMSESCHSRQQKEPSTLWRFTSSDAVLKAEILWAMNIVEYHSSYNGWNTWLDLLKIILPDSENIKSSACKEQVYMAVFLGLLIASRGFWKTLWMIYFRAANCVKLSGTVSDFRFLSPCNGPVWNVSWIVQIELDGWVSASHPFHVVRQKFPGWLVRLSVFIFQVWIRWGFWETDMKTWVKLLNHWPSTQNAVFERKWFRNLQSYPNPSSVVAAFSFFQSSQ